MPKSTVSRPMVSRPTVSSWVLHAMKIILGDESIRQQILLHYHPKLHHGNITKLRAIGNKQNHIKTFNAFIEPEKTRDDKFEKIRAFLRAVVTLKGTVVFTAANVQLDEDDAETHYQTFIVDNDAQKVYMIDPANDRSVDKNDKKYKKSKTILVSGQGIYYAQVAHEIIKPFFEENTDYTVELVQLLYPAQIIENDVFCQSWSLYILDKLLESDDYKTTEVVDIPNAQINKYDTILGFYKRIVRDVPNLAEYLIAEYVGEIENCSECNQTELLKIRPDAFILGMTKADMK
jgi:hypothetical protein